MKKNIFLFIFSFTLLLMSSCETFDLEQTDNPSRVPDSFLDPVYTFNYVQINLPDFVNSANSFTQRVIRQMAMTGGNTYDNAFAPVNSNNNWFIGYNLLNAIKIMEPKAIEKKEFYALGASKVIRVYILMTLVDMYGDIPYSEALMGVQNLTPKYDKSSSVYKSLFVELDEAILILNKTNVANSKINDLYYGGQNSWITLANTLKLKMLCTARLAGTDIGIADVGQAYKDIIVANDYIKTISQDFQFKFGNSQFTPNTRHPLYNDQYENGGGAYISNYFMWSMTTEKEFPINIAPATSTTFIDPRTDFYFYKQITNAADLGEFIIPLTLRPDHYDNAKYKSFYRNASTPFIISNWISTSKPANGFLGRDHGDGSGIPPDATYRTCAGIYPVGGAYGPAGSVQTNGDKGALGAGIMPILLSSYVNFMNAEMATVYPTSVGTLFTPLQELENGLDNSIEKTINFLPNFPYTSGSRPNPATLQAQKLWYKNFITSKYNQAGTNKLELIMKEYHIASWGNGIEPYNAYRRTGYPSNFQPTVEPNSGSFYQTAFYPGSAENNNPNTPINIRTRRVFWDKNNYNLH